MAAKYLMHSCFLNMNLNNIKNNTKDHIILSKRPKEDMPMPNISVVTISVDRQRIDTVKKLISSLS